MIQRDNKYQDLVSLQSWKVNQTPKIQHFYQYIHAVYLWETQTLVNQHQIHHSISSNILLKTCGYLLSG